MNSPQQIVGIAPGSLRAWVLASRPATLPAAAAPVFVGTAVAFHEGAVSLLPFLATLLGAGFLQIASNFANDVFDHEKGTDNEARLGPTRAVQAGLVKASSMKVGLSLSLGLAFLVGIYLVWLAGWPIVVIGLLSMLSAVAYTGGPYPLGYHGLGDVFVLLFFGFIAVGGTTYVQLGHVPALSYAGGAAVGALCTNILVVNNLRDRHTDELAGKRTLAVRWGRRGALIEYIALTVVGYFVPMALVVLGETGPWALLPWLSLPLAVANVRGVIAGEGRVLNAYLVRTARLLFAFGFLFAIGLVCEGWR